MAEVPGSRDRDTASPPVAAVEADRAFRHELRTPLNQILGYSELLREEAQETGQQSFVPDLEKIAEAGRRLLELIDRWQPPSSSLAPAPPAPRTRSPRPPARSAPGAEGRILVVDDNEMNRDLLSRRLARQGMAVEVAADGAEALERLSREAFDLVILDVMMPGMSGIEALERIRRDRDVADLPVIMATARTGSDDVVEALRLGANDYVTKPLDFAVVLARVRTQLSLKRAHDQIRELHARLASAQQRVAELVDSSASGVEGVAAWASRVAGEVADAVGARRVGVWLVGEDGIREASRATGTAGPTAEQMEALARAGKRLRRAADTLLPVAGPSGKVYGALVVETDETFEDSAERLLGDFARHLGSTLELEQMRRELHQAAERRRATRQEMLERGIDLLQICPTCGRCYDHRVEVCADDGEPLGGPRPFPYRIANRYRLLRKVGEGALGTVFRSHDDRLGRTVAVKVVRSELFNDDAVRERFGQEARTVARVNHAGVVSVYDSGELEDGALFLVMEWLEGWDLGAVLRRHGPGTPAQVAELLRQAGAALEAAHHARLVHRDIKPENLFLTAREGGFAVKVLDFGVAKDLAEDVRLTRTGTLVGTPLYMAPEQLDGRPVDARTDLYSLAAVAFFALTGRRTVEADELVEVMLEIVDGCPPRVSDVLSEVPGAVDAVFAEALAKEPAARPGSIHAWTERAAAALDLFDRDLAGWALRIDQESAAAPEEGPLSGIFEGRTRVAASTETPTLLGPSGRGDGER